MAKLARLPLLLLLLLTLPLVGCPDDDDGGFVRNPTDDDDAADDDDDAGDDDDSAQNNTPPTIEIISMTPDIEAGEPLEGDLQVNFYIDDVDSQAFEVSVEFSVDGIDGTFNEATLDGDNPYEDDAGTAPLIDHPGTVVWLSASDIPTIAEDVAIKLCPTDGEGNPGICVYKEAAEPVDNTGTNDLGAFCQPGHLEGQAWINGEALVPLSDGECLNYQKSDPPAPDDFSAQFVLVMVNPESDDVQFTISPVAPPEEGDDDDSAGDDDDDDSTDDDDAGDDDDSAASAYVGPFGMMPALTQTVRTSRTQRRNPLAFGEYVSAFGNELPDRAPVPSLTCEPDLTTADVHNDDRNFEFRDTIESPDERNAVGANLRALGEYIAIYVDDEVPMDFDADCTDDTNPVEENELPAFGFTNCDLEGVVDVFDNNIWPTLTTLYGLPSDVDNNCRVTVLLSHQVNSLTLTNSDDSDDSRLVKSFTEPDIDLWESDFDLNPNSNEEEMIFLYAADPVGFWNDTTVPLADYLNYEVNGQIAIALQDLISYAVHRQVEKSLMDPAEPTDIDNPPAEEDWLNDAMGLLAADVTGFGAISYWDAWIYMDRPHLLPLLKENTMEDFEDRGGQYVFARYLHDLYGDGFIYDVINAEDTQGLDTITAVLEANGYTAGDDDDDDDGEEEVELFDAFALDWATAMAITGLTNEAGGQLVPDTVIPNFHEPTFITVTDPDVAVPGELFGAHGFQKGFDVNGPNVVFASGYDEDTSDSVATYYPENLDPLLFHPQEDFFGTISGFYGVVVVKISGLEQPINYLKIETSSGGDLLGNVIRINDSNPHNPLLTLEDVAGAKITTARRLDTGDQEFGESLDTLLGGTRNERNVIGVIDLPQTINLSLSEELPSEGGGGGDDDDDEAADDDDSEEEEEPEEADISDTDRYAFTLDATTTLGIWVDRRIADITGDVSLADPFLAVVPASDVPDAIDYSQWNFGPSLADGPCGDASLYSYPVVMPDWLAPQANLISNPTKPSGDFIPLVEPQEPLEGDDDDSALPESLPCLYDSDQDGIADADESAPGLLADQIILRQAQNLLVDPEFYDATFGTSPLNEFYDFSAPWFDEGFIDIDSNEDPDDDLATAIPEFNLGGRAALTGEEAVWMGTLPPGEYVIIVGGVGASTGPYDLSVKIAQ